MTKSLIKNTFREIKNSKARFISIMAIIALGVGFLSGIKATVPSMYQLSDDYFKSQNLMDYRLVSTVGFDSDDVKAVEDTEGVSSVMPSYYCDLQTTGESGGSVVRLIAMSQAYGDSKEMNSVVLKEGRLPEKENEIVVEYETIGGTKHEIGDKIVFSENAGDSDLTDQLGRFEYTVVGKVDSPLYISYQRGTTTIGDGEISEFMYTSDENFISERYTELYVKADFSEDCKPYTDEYDSQSDKLAKVLEKTADARCVVFDEDIIQKAKNELEDSKAQYSEEKSDAQAKLDDAREALDSSQSEFDRKILDAQTELDNAKTEIENGRAQLENSKSEYYAQISAAEEELANQETQLKNAEAEYEKSKADFDTQIADAQEKIDGGLEQYQTSYNEFKTSQEPLLVSAIQQAKLAVDSINNAIASETDPDKIAALKLQLEQAQNSLDSLNEQYDNAVSEFEKSKEELDLMQSQLDEQKAEGQAELDDAYAQIENGKALLEEGKAELETQKSDGYSKLSDAENELNAAQSQYDQGVKELETQKSEGSQKLDDARQEYESEKAKAEDEFAKAEAEIKDAQKELDNLSKPRWYVFTRDDNPGYSSFAQNADRLDAVAGVFPMFFLLVAVLVCVTTMTRLIDEKRTEIGTLKALGYSNRSIVGKFVIYSLTAAVLGSAIGIILGISTLPFIIYNAYQMMYYIGDITLKLDYISITIATASAIICTSAVSIAVCMRSLSHKPAEAMRPKAPKAGKRIILEYITPLWNRFGFTAKLTSRNLLRYKSRLCMTVIGVAGCTALIVSAFGLLNSFDPLLKDQFETIYKYDAVVVPKNGGDETELSYLTAAADENKNIENYMLFMQLDTSVEFGKKTKDTDTYISVPQSPSELGSIISLHTRKDKNTLDLTDEGVLINEKLADELGIKAGDTIKLTCNEGKAEVKVCGIFEQYIQNYIYMSPKLYTSLFGKDPVYNMLDIQLKDTSDKAANALSSELLSDERIIAVSFIETSLEDFENMLDSLNLVVLVMIISAAALAFVVLYNLTSINIAERMREIATFKVLGFNNRETSSFIYKENIILTLLGIAVGLVMGIFLTGFIVKTIEVDNIMFGREIYATSYIFAALLTFVFSLLVNAAMSFKIKSVNMVESLKSFE